MLNKVIIIGHLGRDPEIRALQNGDKVANFTVATSEHWRDKASGERKEKTEWHRVVCFNARLSDVIEKYLRKGSKVYVEGQLQTRKWADNQGAERYTTEIVLTKFRGEIVMLGDRQANDEPAEEPRRGGGGETAPARDDLDDEIPFISSWSVF